MNTFDIAVLGICGSVVVFFMGIIWWQLNNRLKKVEDWKVDKGFFKNNNQLIEEKFRGMSARISDMKDFNASDHQKLEDQLVTIRATMAEIRDCMVKLASQKEC